MHKRSEHPFGPGNKRFGPSWLFDVVLCYYGMLAWCWFCYALAYSAWEPAGAITNVQQLPFAHIIPLAINSCLLSTLSYWLPRFMYGRIEAGSLLKLAASLAFYIAGKGVFCSLF
ncbi:uncharacterized protein A4U43_C08F25970 [Asparagus officinalis]|nr:uncharacterized protein A4U43_C08F25970 [Asparagus officinalis]